MMDPQSKTIVFRYGLATLVFLILAAVIWWVRDDAFQQGDANGEVRGELKAKNEMLRLARRNDHIFGVRHFPLPEGMSMIATSDLRILKAMAIKGVLPAPELTRERIQQMGNHELTPVRESIKLTLNA